MTRNEDAAYSMNRLVHGFKVSRILGALAEIGLADLLPPDETRTVGELAAQSGVNVDPLRRSLRLLAARGIFKLEVDDRLRHTPMSLILRSDHPQTVRYAARSLGAPGNWRAWEALSTALHGQIPQMAAWEMGRFAYLSENPVEAGWFDEFMARMGDNRHVRIAETYDFPAQGTIIDVGGGNGELLRQILQRHPNLECVLFDQPNVLSRLSPDQQLNGRIRTVGGSFFEAVPAGGDFYLLTKVLHDWDDADAVRILRAVREAMSADSRLLVNETLLNRDPLAGNVMDYEVDTQMMVMFGGARARTREEFEALCEQARLQLVRDISAGPLISILEIHCA